ncbi:TetR/AcrR family transcriptional regulator [Bacillus changyiensis]|uniref:TetR/AcrR family transcriptional regulator n=1 Tax=Bacillus changyiensis TaxID=3004103 RepID=UPI0022E2E338|nr:TetR/AcrR family transcriptional regulator [Bacillus changyiensis]MDA1475058.1 TetR/AcrR family transcriptional regulator [Bacillus changyiensis]
MSTIKGEQTKEHILNAAKAFIVREGFEKIGVNKIIKEADVSKGSFYHYFPNINELIKEVAIYAFERCLRDMPLQHATSMEEIVEDLGQHIFYSVREQNEHYYLLFLCISKSFIDEELKQAFQSIFTKLVKQNIAATEIVRKGEDDMTRQLYMLDMLAIGFIVHCHLLRDEEQLLELWKQMTAMIFK